MKSNPAFLRWIITLVVAILAAGVAVWRGWLAVALPWGGRLLSRQVPVWVVAVVVLAILGAAEWRRRHSFHPGVPRDTIRIVPQPRGHWWHMGSMAGRPAMQVVSDWFITNITDQPVRLLGAHLARPSTNGSIAVKHPEADIFGLFEIPPRFTTEATADFWVQPPVRSVGQDFKATLVIVDQFGNKHAARNVLFQGAQPPTPQAAQPRQESIHAIADPVEKQVVAVLKDEISRYRLVGRRVGGLGSIQTRYRGQVMTGIGGDWRRADSPERQSIVPDPQQAAIESDNLTALLNLYRGLGSNEERSRFADVLLRRLSRGTEYAPVGYLIMIVLFRIDRLPDALRTARRDLQGDGEFGFSDLMRLLDGLLRFEHPAFTPVLLDEVERFAEGVGVEENTFGIRERIAAIGAFRLAARAE